jgi:hypothetical protein
MMQQVATLISLLGVLFLSTDPAPASQIEPANSALQTNKLPLSKVVLYSSGVGYFQHDGTVQGESHVDLRFTVDQINDVLKSLVVQDAGGGRISTVTYGSRDPIMKTLGSFGINLTSNPTLGQLLDQIRGEPIEVATPNSVKGTIIGVEQKQQMTHEGGRQPPVTIEYLNLLTDEGLRSIPLPQVQRIQLLNAQLNGELQQALSVLAGGHDAQKRAVSILFEGEGTRNVRVAYITEAPIWKTSYRLVLDEGHPPFMQGWAIVDNSTELDWAHIHLSLVSGRPISFVMDLYQPLYGTRPVVVPELYASLQPRVYGDTLDQSRKESKPTEIEEERMEMGKSRLQAKPRQDGFRGAASPEAMASGAPTPLRPQQGVTAAAQAQDAGELFEYAMTAPITVTRHTSAMLPIITQTIEGQKISIYNQSTHAKHPLNGFRLHNNTPLYLMQGPITVFDGNAYAGDARIEDLAPGQDRLLSYALDLKTEVEPKVEAGQQDLVNVSLRKGVLIATHKVLEEKAYHIRNRDQKAKTLLIEHPYRADWQLVESIPPTERTRDVYRFTIQVEAGKTAALSVREEKQLQQTIQLIDSGSDVIMYYLRAKQVSPKVKEALQRVVTFRERLSHTTSRRGGLEQRMKEISQEQTRIRENMGRLAQTSELYNRYVKKLDQQETEMEKLRKEIDALKGTEEEQKRELHDYLLSLDMS